MQNLLAVFVLETKKVAAVAGQSVWMQTYSLHAASVLDTRMVPADTRMVPADMRMVPADSFYYLSLNPCCICAAVLVTK